MIKSSFSFCIFEYYSHICRVKHIRSVIRTASFG
nr:MAG TPA: hypothetical protein [Caudoviricetes sp.]DAX44275.1 MAG TPA: hypothetical protein [Caudoviricetes sp.]